MIKLKADMSGILKKFERINTAITDPKKIGLGLHSAANLLVNNILDRLDVRTGLSGYEQELRKTMWQLDEDFVNRLSGNYYVDASQFSSASWANRTEAERRVKGSGYRRGRITKAIKSVIKASQPIEIADGTAVGIARFDELNNLFTHLGVEHQYKLWQILNYGTGTLGAKGSPVIRTKKQIFFNRKIQKGILAYTTVNPGFKGREFFVKMDGSMHKTDIIARNQIFSYLRSVMSLNPFVT
jgi:hypothetical protein